MVSSVSGMSNNIAFKASAMDKVTPEMMSQPSAFAENYAAPAASAAPEKKGSFLGSVGKLILKAAVVLGVAIAARKYIPSLKNINTAEPLAPESKLFAKLKYGFAKYTDKAKDCTIGKVSKYFKSKSSEVADATKPAENVDIKA